ncbi:hypothetical protein [Pararhizobium sp. A13]|uniref:hypothetical protein n=1 Tax=Pararhizobium sp. A13 TaxID=3133975 RepID=UPI00311B057D
MSDLANDQHISELRQELAEAQTNGYVGQVLATETNEVRIWKILLKPGERIGYHRHQLNYFWVAVSSGKSRSRLSTGETVETEYTPGDCRYFSFGAGQHMTHDLTNIGDTDLLFTTVELKRSANPPLAL